MSTSKYDQAVSDLFSAIDTAIESLKKFPVKEWDEDTINYIITCYQDDKAQILNAEPKFRNMRSLKYDEDKVFAPFHEGSGSHVEYFWSKIKEQNLPFKRENKLGKILKRKKIKDDIEYDFVVDVLVPYMQEGLISEEEANLLKGYIGDFEQRIAKKDKK